MPCDDSKKRNESKSIYELTLSYIHVLFISLPVILLGDFNANLNRYTKNRFDSLLRNFIGDNDLVVLDKIFPQIKSCIRNKIKNRQYFYTQNDVSIFHKPEILNHVTNTSDHLAITIQFEFKIDESIRNNHEKTPDFENTIIFNIYNQYIEEELVGLDSILLNFNKNNTTNNQMQLSN